MAWQNLASSPAEGAAGSLAGLELFNELVILKHQSLFYRTWF
jgi:hypothetical protein